MLRLSMIWIALRLSNAALQSFLAENTSFPLPIISIVLCLRRHRPAALCREACLKGEGFWDPFKPVKDEENKKALKLLPGILK